MATGGVDFAALLRESKKAAKHYVAPGTRVFGKWPRQGVTFAVRRGSFVIPVHLFEDGAEMDLARHFARSMPDEAAAGRRERLAGGAVRIHWRIVRETRPSPRRRRSLRLRSRRGRPRATGAR